MTGRRSMPAVLCLLSVLSSSAAVNAQGTNGRAREAYARAVALEAQGNRAAALSLLWEAAGLAPHDADVQNALGEALERMGALDAAVAAYRRAVSDKPGFRKAANNLILSLVKTGKGEEAVRRARALVAAAPKDPDASFTLGLALSEQDVAEAITSFTRALELEPRHALARYNLALVLKRADRQDEAIQMLMRAIDTDPRAEAYYTLGVIHWQLGDLDRATRALGAAIAAEPRYADAHYTLGAVLADRRQWSGAAESLRRAIGLRPDLAAAHYTLARVLQQSGDAAGGRAELAEGERLRRGAELEQEASVWTSVGIGKVESGDLVGALEQFRRATTVLEAYAPAHYQMGLVLDRLGQHAASRAAFARAAQLNPSLAAK
jgi:superkiller protein 3